MDRNIQKIRKKTKIFGNAFMKVFKDNYDDVDEFLNLKYGRSKYNVLDVYTKKDTEDILILYVHGGGWISMDKELYKPALLYLANRGYMVFNINYRLAPEHSIDNMEKDIIHAMKFALKYSNKSKIFLMGDSAGAHLVSLVTNKLFMNKYKDSSLKDYIVGNGLFYGVFDLSIVRATHFHDIDIYLSSIVKKNKDKVIYSPISYVNKDIPNTFIASGEIDKLNIESKNYYEKLKENNVNVEAIFYPKSVISAHHSFLNYYKSYACEDSLNKMIDFLHNI